MVATALAGLIWTRLLLGAMGAQLYGLFLAFVGVMGFASMGDLGVSGAVGLRAGQLLGGGRDTELRPFLACARGLFVALAALVGGVLFALTPWLPHWLAFAPAAGSGPLFLLFVVGAIATVTRILAGYVSNVNYALGTIVWPISPAFIVAQAIQLAHWQLARAGQPLWIQYLPHVAGGLVNTAIVWIFLRITHPWIAELWPIRFDLSCWRSLLTASGWVYLASIGNVVFNVTDRLMVNAGFGAAAVTPYQLNYKLPELGLVTVLTASHAALPKLTQWFAGTTVEQRVHASEEAHRLNAFQSFLGAGLALGYLAINQLFVRAWLGPGYDVSWSLMTAFATTLAVTAGGDAAIQLCGRCGDKGLSRAGLGIGITALINLALSWLAMRASWIEGIAWATVAAQTLLAVSLTRVVSRYLDESWWKWTRDSVVLPIVLVVIGGWIRLNLPGNDAMTFAKLAAIYSILLIVAARVWGLGATRLMQELSALRGLFRR